jgi:hypothetical protein
MKGIHREILRLRPSSFTPEAAAAAQDEIVAMWKHVQPLLLHEFDRQEPARHDTAYRVKGA